MIMYRKFLATLFYNFLVSCFSDISDALVIVGHNSSVSNGVKKRGSFIKFIGTESKMKYHPIMKKNFSNEETSVIYTEDEFNLHEYFFLIFSAVFIIIMLCVLCTFIFNQCILKCCFVREQDVTFGSKEVL